MSRRKVAYAKKCIDPEEEGEELPFPPREVVIDTSHWVTDYCSLGAVLGRGKFGEVKRCTEKITGLKLAAKMITTTSMEDKLQVRKEVNIMRGLHHPKILQIYSAYEKPQSMCIVMELLEGGELFDRVVDPNFDLTERVAILFMRQIVDGVLYIHSQNVLHLDLKPENIICVARTGTRIKIIDFGLAMKFNTGIKMMAGTIDFMAPEVCNFEEVTPATDMWSTGVICYVLVSGLSPFMGDDDGETICNIMKIDYDFDEEEFEVITAGCKDFIKKLLVKKPKSRMSAEECLKHSWLTKITRAQTTKHLSKKHHLKFFARRKWMKVIRTVMAINRIEKLSARYMRRTKTNNEVLESPSQGHGSKSPTVRSPLRARKHSQSDTTIGGVVNTEPPLSQTASKYDWRANLEARRRHREAGRSPEAKNHENHPKPRADQEKSTTHPLGRIDLKSKPHTRDQPIIHHAIPRGVNHHDQEKKIPASESTTPNSRQGRLNALSPTPKENHNTDHHTRHGHLPERLGAAKDTRDSHHQVPIGRQGRLAEVSGAHHETGDAHSATPKGHQSRLAGLSGANNDTRKLHQTPGVRQVRLAALSGAGQETHKTDPPKTRQGRLAALGGPGHTY